MKGQRRRRPVRDLNPRITRRRKPSARLRRPALGLRLRPRRSGKTPTGVVTRPAIRLLILAIEVLALLVVINSPVLAARQVSVTGNKRLTTAQVIDRAGLDGQPSMLLLSADGIAADLLPNPYVRSVSVRTLLPGRVDIEIQEWEPLAVVSRAGGFYLLNAEGTVLEVVGAATVGTGPGQPHVAVTWDAPGLLRVGQSVLPARLVQDFDRVWAAFPAAYGLTISSFGLDSNQKLTANTTAGPRILFGQMATDEQISSLDAKLASLKSLRSQVDLAHSKLDYIDLENPAAVSTHAIPSPSPSPRPSASPTKKP